LRNLQYITLKLEIWRGHHLDLKKYLGWKANKSDVLLRYLKTSSIMFAHSCECGWAGRSVSQSVLLYCCKSFPHLPPVCPGTPHWYHIFQSCHFPHPHNLPCYEYQRSTSLAIPRVSHNMPKSFINSDLKHFWECQGFGGKNKRGQRADWGKSL
jgi:hypothetical protein